MSFAISPVAQLSWQAASSLQGSALWSFLNCKCRNFPDFVGGVLVILWYAVISVTMRLKLRSIMVPHQWPTAVFYVFTAVSLFWSADTLTFLKEPELSFSWWTATQTDIFLWFIEVQVLRGYAFHLSVLKRVKTNRSENKSNVAHQRCQVQENNLLILIYGLYNPLGKNMFYSGNQQIK